MTPTLLRALNSPNYITSCQDVKHRAQENVLSSYSSFSCVIFFIVFCFTVHRLFFFSEEGERASILDRLPDAISLGASVVISCAAGASFTVNCAARLDVQHSPLCSSPFLVIDSGKRRLDNMSLSNAEFVFQWRLSYSGIHEDLYLPLFTQQSLQSLFCFVPRAFSKFPFIFSR